MTTPSFTDDTGQPDSHYQLLRNAIPDWLGKASSAKHQAVSQAKPKPLHASPALLGKLKRLNAAHWSAQNTVDDALKNVQAPRAYARGILEEALLTRYGLNLNSEAVYLRLYIPQTVTLFKIPSGAARTWTVSLLDAALHNFEQGETVEGAYEPASTFITRPTPSGQFDTLPATLEKISIRAFTVLCRELDIGARYSRYLRLQLGLTEPLSAAVIQNKVETSQKAALRAALHLAKISADIKDDFAQQVDGLLHGRSDLMLGNLPLRCHCLTLMGAPLAGILLLAPDLETTRSVQRLVAYVPDDPLHPLKEYPSALAFKQELTRQLSDANYQTFFSRFVSHEHRGVFFAGLSQRLARITWHPPVHGSGQAPWRKEPTDDPKLQFVATPIQDETWQHLYQQKLNQILNDARSQAVSTAEADRAARWARWDSFVNVASSILNAALLIVAPFIPGLGELMLAYMAYQLLDDIFEGVIDWAEGLDQEAFGHLMSVLQSLVQLGIFGLGSHIGVTELRKVLPQEVLTFIDRFKPVTLANGAKRYWKPDLAPYQQDIKLPPKLGHDSLGLHQMRGEPMLAMDDKLYTVQKAAEDEDYVIKHPTRPDAYAPRLQHNCAGAWHSELDTPLQWDEPTLLGRLGHGARGLGEADRRLALNLSGVKENALRQMHVQGEPIPPLFDDTLERLRIDRDLQTLIAQLNSDNPDDYAQIDPQDTLQLLTTHGNWPNTRSLRMLNAEGRTAWEFGDMRMPVVQIHETQLTNGELLKTVLQALSPEEIRAQFGESAADPQLSLDNRVKQLRKKLGRLAEQNRTELFESRYAQQQLGQGTSTQVLAQAAPGLPAKVVTHLLDHASAYEQSELDHQRTPTRLADLASAALAELRLNRAYEGQHLIAPPNLDSEKLALNTLRVQPGWSANMRIEARHLTVDGEKWLQIGSNDAPLLRTLVRTADGRYVPHDEKGPLFGETDLYTATLSALPDAQRNALGFHVNQGPALQQRLRLHPLPRDELRKVLEPEMIRPPSRETLHALGMDAGYRVQADPTALPLTLEQRARALYPAFDARQINDVLNYLRSQPEGAANGLAALAEEYRQLDSNLSTWRRQVIDVHPDTGQPLTAPERRNERQNRRMIAKELRRCWRRETEVDDYFDDASVDGHSLRLEYPILGALPELTANFNHVSLLTLSGPPQTPGASAFLQHFRQLRHLSVRGFNLGTVPDSIFTLPRLNSLSLSNCQIRLDLASQARIASLRRLQTLELADNPLGLAPAIEGIPDLIHLDLSNTGIDQLPAGALTRPELQVALLNDNQIQTLHPDFFKLPPRRADAFFLSHNPLSRPTLEQVKRYYQRHGTTFGADALPADVRDARLLYPSMGETELNELIYSLPGTLEAGQIELARRAAELETLQGQLSRWEQTPGTAPQELARRISLRRLLESCWRRELTPDSEQRHLLIMPRNLAGELPTLDASFPHITSLMIRCNDAPINVDSFLDSFPELRAISLDRARLGDIPPAICALPKLEVLDLENCSVTLTPTSRANLERMSQLKHLNLSNNALGETVDFSQLPHLTTLLLRNTRLSAVPPSLLTQTPRDLIDLSANSITQLPPELFALPGDVGRAFDLFANPLTRQSLEQVKTYCQRTDEFFNIQTPATHRDRAKRLYPKMQETDLNKLIFGLPGDLDGIDSALTALEADYHQLVADLQRWVDDIPAQHPLVGGALEDSIRVEEELNRQRLKLQLEKAWRRETPEDTESLEDRFSHAVELDVPIIGAMPILRTRFEHVSSLQIKGTFTVTDVNGTLTRFGALQTLIVNNCTLGELPSAIFSMPHLDTLDLSDCEISLTTSSARALGDLHDLEYLHLGNNPLNNAPDVTHLQQLSSLHLARTRISEMPAGVFQLPLLQTLDLSNNTISEITPHLMEMLQVFDDESDLSGNPWSAESLRRLREYYRQTGVDFQIHEINVDGNGVPLVPELDEAMDEE